MSCCPSAGIYNITCNQGATFSRTLTWTDVARKAINITGYTARMHVRSLVSSVDTLIDLTTENGRITISNPTAGQVTLTISAVDTATLTPDKYVYDLELVSPTGVVNRLVEGNFVVKAEVTR
jgi:hypothetical protein